MARQDLEIARAEIEHPNHSLRPNEVREVIREDRAGHQITEFHTKLGPSFWMNDFAPDTISYVSGGSAGIGTEDGAGTYRLDKSHLPEYREAARQLEYQQAQSSTLLTPYIKAGVAPPNPAELARMVVGTMMNLGSLNVLL